MSAPEQVRIIRCRKTRHGLLVLFSDDQAYLFHNSFLVQNRVKHADRIVDRKAIETMLGEARLVLVDESRSNRANWDSAD
jgi:hypothetical protein